MAQTGKLPALSSLQLFFEGTFVTLPFTLTAAPTALKFLFWFAMGATTGAFDMDVWGLECEKIVPQ